MKKLRRIIVFGVIFLLLLNFRVTNVFASEKIYLGGVSCGFILDTKGVLVVGLSDVLTADGGKSPAKEAGVLVGDIILSIDNTEINSSKDIEDSIYNKNSVLLEINRNNETFFTKVIPAKDICDNLRLGVFVRNSVSGIGTLTYIKGDSFGALGHTVSNTNGNVLKITGGKLYKCNISNVIKGEKGCAGELRGCFVKDSMFGVINDNKKTGVYGKTLKNDFNLPEITFAKQNEIKVGDAKIYSTVCGEEVKEYDIKIVKTDFSTADNRNFVIKIVDEELIEKTGGIVQGMSGSPIVQNGKLIGAVTHVFINDPERGFGIFIENMING